MEVMEDGNLIDKVNILIQRDMEYYTSKQAILQETICPGIIGGKLDFPRSASFASMKLVLWWEEEFVAAHKKPSGFLPKSDDKANNISEDEDEGIIKDSYPSKFVSLIAKTADQLLVHLNILTQEALDHADLTVLTGTIGATALLKNCLWFYIKLIKDNNDVNVEELQNSYKKYYEMCEALAERLLDLHCRLVSLYILQDAECLDWENEQPFFESERGSYVIQMWWLYMKGTKEDLWNTVPPRMAQRVFAGMLNESLTILTVRYTQSITSETRNQLIVVDISNLLVCVAELLPAICENAKELIGFSYSTSSKILRDIHTKCQELLTCLLLRGSPIDVLHKSITSKTRNQLIVVDISNLLVCVAELVPAICENAKELIGFSYSTSSKILRDIHTKCQELLTCLLLRGSPIDVLHKAFRKGLDNVEMFKSRAFGVAPWIVFALPNIFDSNLKQGLKMGDLSPDVTIALELMVMLAQPQPNWAQLIKVLCINKFKVLQLILNISSKNFSQAMQKPTINNKKCKAFLCNSDGSCKNDDTLSESLTPVHYYDLIASSTEILIFVGSNTDLTDILLPIIMKLPDWSNCLERRHVWNQIRQPWYEAVINFTLPIIPIAGDTVINAVQTGATMYQAMSLVIACFCQFWDYINPGLYRISCILQDSILTETVPLNNSTLIQILICSLYSYLLQKSQETKKEVRIEENLEVNNHKLHIPNVESHNTSPEAISLAIAESLCSIDEDNKHTDQIEELLELVRSNSDAVENDENLSKRLEVNQHIAEVVVSDILDTSSGRKSLKILYWYIKCNAEFFYKELGISSDTVTPNKSLIKQMSLLYTMFNIGRRPFDQLLSGEWHPNWLKLLQNHMGLNADRVWKQLLLRWEFRNINSPSISANTVVMINNITSVFKQ